MHNLERPCKTIITKTCITSKPMLSEYNLYKTYKDLHKSARTYVYVTVCMFVENAKPIYKRR